jgi:tetratricopeptide (TPR) repeat protein
MKRSERHRLKQNELATSVVHARESFERHRRAATVSVAAVVIIAIAVGGYWFWRARTHARSAELLAKATIIMDAAVVPPPSDAGMDGTAPPPPQPGTYPSERAKLDAALPRFVEAADSHPKTPAAIVARYYAASILSQLGRAADAERRYREVIDLDGTSVYADMARMGLAAAQTDAGKYDEAIKLWQELSARNTADLPTEGVLVELARTYARAGKAGDAANTYNRIVKEFPESDYASVAKQERDALDAAKR